MNQKIEKLCLKSVGYVKKNSAFILTCAGAAGLVATSVMTAKATVKAVRILNEKECEKGGELTKKRGNESYIYYLYSTGYHGCFHNRLYI